MMINEQISINRFDGNIAGGSTSIELAGDVLSAGELFRIARAALNPNRLPRISVSPAARENIVKAANFVSAVVSGDTPVYGVNTGVGHFADVAVAPHKLEELQHNIIRSHCCNVGEPLPRDIVMAMWLLRLNNICQGYSGIRLETVDAILQLLNAGMLAVVPSRGSVGASGDLSPSAHAALVLLGEGICTAPGLEGFQRISARAALERAGLDPLRLAAKEGLCLINGTALTTALALRVWHEGSQLLKIANMSAGLMLEALGGSRQPFDSRVLKLHRHAGTLRCGEEVSDWLSGRSPLHENMSKQKWAQDPYSLRCVPQVHGAIWEELHYAEGLLGEKIHAVADNPLLFPDDGQALSCGNFHAMYTARLCDRLASALTTLASISERRTNLAMDSRRTGLPDFLIDDGGLQSGFMMAQVTAAALVSECKALSFPASVDSIPTNNDQEDHVSMGPTAGFKALAIAEKLRYVLCIELLVAAQALDLRRPLRSTSRLEGLHRRIRQDVAPLTRDRVISDDIELIAKRLEDGDFEHLWSLTANHNHVGPPAETNGHARHGPPKPHSA